MEVQTNTLDKQFDKQIELENSQASSTSSTRSSRSTTANQRKSILKTETTKSNTKKNGKILKSEISSSTLSSSSSISSPNSNSNSDNTNTLVVATTTTNSNLSVSFVDQTNIDQESKVKASPVKQQRNSTRLSTSRLNNNNNNTNNNNDKKTPNGRTQLKNKQVESITTEIKQELIEECAATATTATTAAVAIVKKSPIKKKQPLKEKNAKFCPNDENTLDGFNNKEVKEDTIVTATPKNKIKINSKSFVSPPLPPPPPHALTASLLINESSSNNTQSNDETTQEGNTNNNNDEEQNQTITEGGEPSKKKRRRRTMLAIMMTEPMNNGHTSASSLFIYKWPDPESLDNNNKNQQDDKSEPQDTYLLQEQISEYLGVKSFKRKYPDLFRRLIDLKEREYLKENKVVSETQCDLGLTALKLSECLDIMAEHYPDKYKELNDVLYEKRRKNHMKNIDAHLNEMQAGGGNNENNTNNTLSNTTNVTSKPRPGRVAMSEADRMKELIKKTMKSVSNYNLQLQKEKKEERNLYFDLQTMRIQKPSQSQRNFTVKYSNPNGQYPVALLPGQYQHYYKRYTSDELKYLPVNTVIHAPPTPDPILYEEWKRQQNQPTSTTSNLKTHENNASSDDEQEKYETYTETYTTSKKLPTHQATSNKIVNILANNNNLNNSNNNTNPISHINNHSPNSFRITVSAAPTVASLINNKPSTTVVVAGAASIQLPANILPKKAATTTPIFKECYVCKKTSQTNAGTSLDQFMIGCSSCSQYSHPQCLELNPSLVNWQCIRQYDWQCMECKRCTKCNNPHDEDKMMFCDRCDRGFHTYCIGLKEVPNGTWLCKSCDTSNNSTNSTTTASVIGNENHISFINQQHIKQRLNSSLQLNDLSTPSSVRTGKRGRPPGSLNKPKDPNSPKKQPKSLTKKIRLEHNIMGVGSVGMMNRDEESMDGYDDELSNNLSLENLNNLINISISDHLVNSNY